uniref:Uncharacterized protein n=1 Tax=Anguilla anguilla TaxID=7936 RepID=A0A0E9WW30_ANGAN
MFLYLERIYVAILLFLLPQAPTFHCKCVVYNDKKILVKHLMVTALMSNQKTVF